MWASRGSRASCILSTALWATLIVAPLSRAWSAAALQVEWLSSYQSGPETCAPEQKHNSGERGQWVQVPINYQQPNGRKTPIYFWTRQKIVQKKPVLIFVSGGPGASMHGEEFRGLESEFNAIYFDPRGMNCSKPVSEKDYRDPAFYSMEAIARDIEEIREAIGAPLISVYGHSSGTAIATIYGSLFPKNTRAVILEGTVARGGPSLYRNEATREKMQAHFESYPEPRRKRILELSRDPRVNPSWFSRAAQFMMYLDSPFEKLDYWLNAILPLEGEALYGALQTFDDNALQEESEFGFGLMLHLMTVCQELGQDSPHADFYYEFDSQGRLIPENRIAPGRAHCLALGARTKALYSASRYPLSVPVTYFQGETDGATADAEASFHFSQVPRGFAQYLRLEKGGHLPIQQSLTEVPRVEDSETQLRLNRLQRQVFAHAVMGKPIPHELLDELNSLSELKWDYMFSGVRSAQSGL